MVIENTIPTNKEGVLGCKESLLHSLETMTGLILGCKEPFSQGPVLGGLHRIDAKTRLLLGTMALGFVLITAACNFDRRDSRWHPEGFMDLKPGLSLCEGEYIVGSLEKGGVRLKKEGGGEKMWNPDKTGLYCSDDETMYSIIRRRGDNRSYYPKALHQRLDIFKRSYKPKR